MALEISTRPSRSEIFTNAFIASVTLFSSSRLLIISMMFSASTLSPFACLSQTLPDGWGRVNPWLLLDQVPVAVGLVADLIDRHLLNRDHVPGTVGTLDRYLTVRGELADDDPVVPLLVLFPVSSEQLPLHVFLLRHIWCCVRGDFLAPGLQFPPSDPDCQVQVREKNLVRHGLREGVVPVIEDDPGEVDHSV